MGPDRGVMKMGLRTVSRGAITISLSSAGLSEGCDIQSITVRGRTVPPTRKGEFSSYQEAEEAGIKRAEEFARKEGLIP